MHRINLITTHSKFVSILTELSVVEKDREYCIHNIEHLLNVARIMMITNFEQCLGFEKYMIYATALLHDIGRLEQYKSGRKHAAVGSELASHILIDCEFSPDEIGMMCKAIATHSNDEQTNALGQLLRTADKLSRNCFVCIARSQCNWSDEQMNKGIII